MVTHLEEMIEKGKEKFAGDIIMANVHLDPLVNSIIDVGYVTDLGMGHTIVVGLIEIIINGIDQKNPIERIEIIGEMITGKEMERMERLSQLNNMFHWNKSTMSMPLS